MASDEDPVAILQRLDLTEYEARCFVALVGVEAATAAELHEVSGIPRSRIYDITQRLAEKGLIEIEHSSTRRYRSFPIEQVVEQFETEYAELLDALDDGLSAIEADATVTEAGMWTLFGATPVNARAKDLIRRAETELVVAVPEVKLLDPACLRHLREAVERGVELLVVTESEAVREALVDELPEGAIRVRELGWLAGGGGDSLVARIVLSDRKAVLLATCDDREPVRGPSVKGVWASGSATPLVTIVTQFVTGAIDEPSAIEGAAEPEPCD